MTIDRLTNSDLEEAASFSKNVTGINSTIFIFPRGIAIADPPDSPDLRECYATITHDGTVIGKIDPLLLRQVQRFVQINHAALTAYWDYKIYTDELQRRLQSI